MEHFRNETLEYFGGERGEKHCVKVSNKKKSCMQICHYIVAEESQYCDMWQLIKERKRNRNKKKTMLPMAFPIL